jgi:hypothetical protein
MKIVVGNPVEGVNFFGRELEQRQLWRKLETSHILMLAPRRIGKTSLIKRLRDTADQHNSKVLYRSFAPCHDELACMNELNKARFFLNWFRDLRQTHAQNIKWLLAGSIGLDTVTKRFRFGDTINDLVPYPLGAFDDETAQNLLLKLAKLYGLNLAIATCDYIINKIGWSVPYYLQVMLDQLLDRKTDSARIVTPQDVDQTFTALLDPVFKAYFDYWHQRLTEELGKPDDTYAVHLLNHICRDPKGVSKGTLIQALLEKAPAAQETEERFNYLIDALQSDGYLIENNQRYQFRLAWLREYWLKRVAV